MKRILDYFDLILNWLGRIVKQRVLVVILVGFLAFSGSAFVTLLKGAPLAIDQDEASYLLAADTFAHGRLTNPTHPMWVHFESSHVIHKPSYMSKFPPAQGLVLALGQVVTGYPYVGLWIGMALMCAAITWMLQAWVPARWALLGGLLSILHTGLGITSSGNYRYWGGPIVAFGGALVFGALRRIVRKPSIRNSLVLGLGLVVLANGRPYEGVVVSLPVAGVLLYHILNRKRQVSFAVSFRTIVLPVTLVIIIAAIWMGYYNKRITGNILLSPYQLHEQTYDIAPHFVFQKPRPKPAYHHKIIHDFQTGWRMGRYLPYRTIRGFLNETASKMDKIRILFAPQLWLAIPLVSSLLLIWRNPWICFTYLVLVVHFAGLTIETFLNDHHSAPIAGLIFVLIIQGMRVLGLMQIHRRRIGKQILSILFLIYVVIFIGKVGFDTGKNIFSNRWKWYEHRAEIIKTLEKEGGGHLIIVRYGDNHPYLSEWVYNEADIDNSPVVWAHDMGQANNRELIEYFKNRTVWLLETKEDDESWLLDINKEDAPVQFGSYSAP